MREQESHNQQEPAEEEWYINLLGMKHRIIECLQLEGTLKNFQFQPPCHGQGCDALDQLPSLVFNGMKLNDSQLIPRLSFYFTLFDLFLLSGQLPLFFHTNFSTSFINLELQRNLFFLCSVLNVTVRYFFRGET